MLTITEIRDRLKQVYCPGLMPESPYRENYQEVHPSPAAVLIPFFQMNNSWHLLFIRRTEIPNDRHSGQVAFPGGRCDPTDLNAEETALREAREEVGINPHDVQILGRLKDMQTITNYRVTPIVGVIPWPYNFIPQEEEVAHIFSIPLEWLVNPVNRQIHELKISGRRIPVIYFKKYDGEMLWGVSARITLLLLEALELTVPHRRII